MSFLEDALSLNKSGGIYFEGDRVTSDERQNILFIGLGGTGADAMIRVKNQVQNRMIPPKDQQTGLPISDLPSNIAFLALDSDHSTKNRSYGDTTLRDHEFFGIGARDGGTMQAIVNAALNDKANGHEYAQGFDSHMTAVGAASGANGARAVGRLVMMSRYSDIRGKIEGKLNAMRMQTHAPKTQIFVFAGIGGGTGSGTFIDMGYLLHEIAGPGTSVYGFAFLPDINELDGGNADMMRANAYATLKEHSYLQDRNRVRGIRFEQMYGTAVGDKVTQDIPYDFCHLVDARDMNGQSFSKEEIFRAIAESVFAYITKDSGAVTGLDSLYNNIPNQLIQKATENECPAYNGYLAFGANSKRIPYTEITTLVACQMFEMLNASVFRNQPTDRSVVADAIALNLCTGNTDNQLETALLLRLNMNEPIKPDMTKKQYAYNNIWGSTNRAMADANEYIALKNSNMDGNYSPKAYEVDLINFLTAAIADQSRGPYYLLTLLGSRIIPLLVNYVNIFQREAMNHATAAKNCEQRLQNLYSAGAKANLLKRGSSVNDYLSTLNDYVNHKVRTSEFEYLKKLTAQLVVIYQPYLEKILLPLSKVLSELTRIFRENLSVLKVREQDMAQHPDEGLIITPFGFQNKYSQQFAACVTSAAAGFMTEIRDNLRYWIGAEIQRVNYTFETQTSVDRCLSNYVSKCFDDIYRNITMETIIQGMVPQGDTIQNYVSRMIGKLNELTNPLFAVGGSYHEPSLQKNIMISYPVTCVQIATAIQNYVVNNGLTGIVTLKPSDERSRIQVIDVSAGHTVNSNGYVKDWEIAYSAIRQNASLSIYLHLDGRWVDKMPNIYEECSWVQGYVCEDTLKMNRKYRAMFNYCYKNGLITYARDPQNQSVAVNLKLADDTINMSNICLNGSLNQRRTQLATIKRRMWSDTRVLKLYNSGVYQCNAPELGEGIQAVQLSNYRENALRDPLVWEKLEQQCALYKQFEQLEQAMEYPRLYLLTEFGQLIIYNRANATISIRRFESDPLPEPLIGTAEAFIYGDINYYYQVYEKLTALLNSPAAEEWIKIINDTLTRRLKITAADKNEWEKSMELLESLQQKFTKYAADAEELAIRDPNALPGGSAQGLFYQFVKEELDTFMVGTLRPQHESNA